MTSKKPTHNYATLSTPGNKKISVCARRFGSRERMSVIAVCTNEGDAEKIVDALNLLQGELAKLEVPAQRVLEQVREQLAQQRALHSKYHSECLDLNRELNGAKLALRQAEIARDTALKHQAAPV